MQRSIPKQPKKLVFNSVGFATNFLSWLAPCSRTMSLTPEQKIGAASLSYQTRPETWNLDCAKAPGFDDRKGVHIANIDPFAIVESRELSRGSKSKFMAESGINSRFFRLFGYIQFFISAVLLTTSLCAHDDWSLNNHFTVLGDFVYLRRSEVHSHKVVNDSKKVCHDTCSDFGVLETKTLVNDFDFEPGYRIGVAWMPNKKSSFEASYLWVEEWEASHSNHGQNSLSFPFDNPGYAKDYQAADHTRATFKSRFWQAEFNYWKHVTPRRVNYFSVSWLAGLRYFLLDEGFNLVFRKANNKSNYQIRTKNHLYAAQLGANLQINPTRMVTWDITIKAGGFANHASQRTFLGDNNNTIVLRDYDTRRWCGGVLADAAIAFGLQVWSHLNIHVGYQFLYLGNIAVAPEQIDKKTGAHSGRRLYLKGEAIIHGLFSGLTLGF